MTGLRREAARRGRSQDTGQEEVPRLSIKLLWPPCVSQTGIKKNSFCHLQGITESHLVPIVSFRKCIQGLTQMQVVCNSKAAGRKDVLGALGKGLELGGLMRNPGLVGGEKR